MVTRTKKYNVLVFPAGTEIAFEIHAALRHSKFLRLFGATSVPCHAEMVFAKCRTVPFADDPKLIDALNELVEMWDIDFIYPAHDDALLKLTQEQDRLLAKVVTSGRTTVDICRNKRKTYEFLEGADFLPTIYRHDEVTEYPVFAKPEVGQGSQGAEIIWNGEQLEAKLKTDVPHVVCEYLPGKEYTVDCFTNKYGELLYVGQRTRERIRSGIAVRSTMVDTGLDAWRIADHLNSTFNFNGAWFFQVKEGKNGFLKLLEVAPRIAGTMGLSRNLGVNMPLLTLYNMLDEDVYLICNPGSLMLDRAFISRFKTDIDYDSVFVDFDDTLVCKGKVNPFLMAFLYQCQGKGKRIYMLTRNKNASHRLALNGISPYLFTRIVYVDKEESKADYVEGKAVFIDDSFRERKSVSDKGIPVYDLDAVESLFDWRA